MIIISYIFAIILGLFLVVFLRALSARVVTGKWPHQDEQSKKIFEDLP